MKLKKFLGIMMAVATVTSMASCGDDKEDDEKISPAAEIAGTYVGTVSSVLMDTTYADTLVVVKVSDSEVAISSSNPSAKLKGVDVNGSSSSYLLVEGSNFYEEIGMRMNAAMPLSVYSSDNSTGKQLSNLVAINGSVKGGTLTISFGGAPGAMPMQIDYLFTGTKK